MYILRRCRPEQQGDTPGGTDKLLKEIQLITTMLASKSQVSIDGRIVFSLAYITVLMEVQIHRWTTERKDEV